MRQWLFLLLAIISEAAGTSALKYADGFTRFWPSAIVVVGYASAFFLLSLTLKTIPVGVAYAIWSGVGTALIALIGWIFIGQKLDTPAVVGILLILLGVIVLNVFSKSVAH
jgi:small multidrug resistance pump